MSCLSNRLYSHPYVESVEPVEYNSRTHSNQFLEDRSVSTDNISPTVESVTKKDLASYFSTLSTILNKLFVEQAKDYNQVVNSELKETPQVPLIPQAKKEDIGLLIGWMQVVVDEGHIEPSQPLIGSYLGWPNRSFHIQSLYVDFFAWCRQKGIEETNIPDQSICTFFFDELFARRGDRYEFPPLQVCRNKLLKLKKDLII